MEAKAKEISLSLSRTFTDGVSSWKMSASIGVAVAPWDGKDFVSLYNNADASLYKTKQREKTDTQFLADHKLYGKGSKSYCDLLPYFNAFFCSERKEEIVSGKEEGTLTPRVLVSIWHRACNAPCFRVGSCLSVFRRMDRHTIRERQGPEVLPEDSG